MYPHNKMGTISPSFYTFDWVDTTGARYYSKGEGRPAHGPATSAWPAKAPYRPQHTPTTAHVALRDLWTGSYCVLKYKSQSKKESTASYDDEAKPSEDTWRPFLVCSHVRSNPQVEIRKMMCLLNPGGLKHLHLHRVVDIQLCSVVKLSRFCPGGQNPSPNCHELRGALTLLVPRGMSRRERLGGAN